MQCCWICTWFSSFVHLSGKSICYIFKLKMSSHHFTKNLNWYFLFACLCMRVTQWESDCLRQNTEQRFWYLTVCDYCCQFCFHTVWSHLMPASLCYSVEPKHLHFTHTASVLALIVLKVPFISRMTAWGCTAVFYNGFWIRSAYL